MKKITLALLLIFALCASLIACGEKKDGADYVFEALANLEDSMQPETASPENAPVKVTLSVADIASICELIGADLGGLPIGAASFGVTASGTNAAADLAVGIGDKNLTLGMVSDGENLVLTSDQLSSNYGGTVEEILAVLGDLSGVDMDALMAEMPKSLDLEKAEALDARYEELLEKLVRENIAFTVEKADKNVVVSCALTPENIAAVGSAFVAEVQQDEEMLALIQSYGGEAALEEIKATSVDRDALAAELTESGFGGTLTMTAVEKTSEFIALALDMTGDETPVSMDLAYADGKYTAAVVAEEVEIEVAFEVAGDLDIAVTAEGETVEVHFDCTKTETSYEALLEKVTVGGMGLDLSQFGIKLTVETGVEVPVVPTEFTSIAGYTAEQFQGILLEFIMSSGLLAYMQ